MRNVGDALAAIGFIRHDLDSCFTFGRELGTGSFATVNCVQRKYGRGQQSEQLAAKVIRPTQTTEAVALEASYNVIAHSHPNICQFFGIFLTQRGWAMLMERCNGGDLTSYVLTHNHLAEEQALDLVGKSVFSALGHLHGLNILHRDVKPDNLLIDHRPGATVPHRAVLVDFGISCHLSDRAKLSIRCGSPGSCAPEVLTHIRPRHSPKADVFGAGVCLYFALGAQMPFKGCDPATICRINARAKVVFEGEAFEDLAGDTKRLLETLLIRSAQLRPTATRASALIRARIEERQSIRVTPSVSPLGSVALVAPAAPLVEPPQSRRPRRTMSA
jgi:serine/threonine protein kinase